jgi:hypothetical protein
MGEIALLLAFLVACYLLHEWLQEQFGNRI